jgi:hypothetical protein
MGDDVRLVHNVLVAADRWARRILRDSDGTLRPEEQDLLDAVIALLKKQKGEALKPPPLPKPPLLPRDLSSRNLVGKTSRNSKRDTEVDFFDRDTFRYSDIPTKPSPPFGTPIIEEEDEE